MSDEKSIAHKHDMNMFGLREWPDRNVPWREARAPDIENMKTMSDAIGRMRSCAYCGSMHPADVAEAIRQGAKGGWADRKYGWPHKAYFDNVPNPHAGMPEIRSSSGTKDSVYTEEHVEVRYNQHTGEREDRKWYSAPPTPATATTYGKFYSVHLQDATPEDRALIEQHLGLSFEFDEAGGVMWKNAYPPNLNS